MKETSAIISVYHERVQKIYFWIVIVLIAGGMGVRAQNLFMSMYITVIVGAQTDSPEELAKALASGTLKSGDNICDH